MLVKNWYNNLKNTLSPGMNAREVRNEFLGEDVSSLPVVDESGQYLGMLHLEDFVDAERNERVKDYVVHPEFFVLEEDTLEEVALLLMENHEMVVPVTDASGKYLGTISIFEILEAFTEMAAFEECGVSLLVRLSDAPGQLREVLNLLALGGINVLSVLTYRVEQNHRNVFLKVDARNPTELQELLDANHIQILHMHQREGY
ncbi:MAG TPA: CBS domain-containing protein [Thermotogota bacterium]|nr:CBS domain-containing protein [Thermotogota bacterium]HRW91543.1 CBS domain-containing protein [Thermotogota bacterium]